MVRFPAFVLLPYRPFQSIGCNPEEIMRTPFVAGNWKMYKTVAEARHLVSELVPGLQAINKVERVLCPPFTTLLAVRALLEGTELGLGAQNLYWEASGAYTGEISPAMVAELCQFVIIGHSERRTYFGETDNTVNRRVQAALVDPRSRLRCWSEWPGWRPSPTPRAATPAAGRDPRRRTPFRETTAGSRAATEGRRPAQH